jgi:putative flippase GtrA
MRWLKFNAVGAMGMIVHLGLLGLLVHVFKVHYLLATAVSVETAILHNFVWHRRWTWVERSDDRTTGPVIAAFLRFNLTNGLVSLISNLFSAYLLTGFWHLDPVLSNLLSLVPSSVVNYLLSDRVVFRLPVSNPNQSEI